MITQEIITNKDGKEVSSGQIVFKNIGEEFDTSITVVLKIVPHNIKKFTKAFNLILSNGWTYEKTKSKVVHIDSYQPTIAFTGSTVINKWELTYIYEKVVELVEKWQL